MTTRTTARTTALAGDRWTVLASVLAVGYLIIAATSPIGWIRWTTLAGGLLVLAALHIGRRQHVLALTLLVAGAALPAVVSWWSLVIPLTGVLILICGLVALNRPAQE